MPVRVPGKRYSQEEKVEEYICFERILCGAWRAALIR